MQRYSDSVEDLDEFCAVTEALEAQLPIKPGWSLLDAAWDLRAHTAGCIGNLLAWSQAALFEMLIAGDKHLKLCHFRTCRFTLQLLGVEKEIQGGEKLLKRVELLDDTTLRQRLDANETPGKQPKKGKPFQRKPKRDPVGAKT